MKKLVLVLLVAMLSVPAFAAPVIKLAKGTGADLGKVLVYVDANSGSLASGIGLTVTATGGNITDVTGFKADGESKATSKGYGIFPGQITFEGAVPTYNSPVASGLNTPVVKLEFGALYKRTPAGDAPDPCSLLCKLTVASGVTKVEVAGDSVSCGTVAGGAAAGIITEAFGAFAVNASLTLAAPTRWDASQCAGQPEGDATCDGAVNLADLFALKASWGKATGQAGYNCGADFDHSGTVNLADLFKLKAKWGTSGYTPSTGIQTCP